MPQLSACTGVFQRVRAAGLTPPLPSPKTGREKMRLPLSSFVHRVDLTSGHGRRGMQNEISELDQLQSAYKAAVEEWIAAIKQEEASVNHSVAEVDQWEQAHFNEEAIRGKVKAAKKQYEDALRKEFFGF
jgi:hypothetical protein